jgi:ABC-type multidrug transport system ATPase subunit
MSTGHGWAVEVRGLAKSFVRDWRGSRVEAVRGISFTVAPGKVLGLLGPNGSGKSTTLKALAGLLTPTQGECFIGGHPAGHDRARAQVGYLPETPRFART